MISDYSVPAGCRPARSEETGGEPHLLSAAWQPAELRAIARQLAGTGRRALRDLSDDRILRAWEEAVTTLLDPASEARRRLDVALMRSCRLSAPALEAALQAVLGGMAGEAARRLVGSAARLERRRHGLVVAVLAANVPALAAQVLLPALALRRPVLLKSSSREPLLAAALVHLLVRADRELSEGLAAVTWKGGERALEDPVLDAAETLVVFGDDATLEALGPPGVTRPSAAASSGHGTGREMLGHGSRFSLAVVSHDADLEVAAAELAPDIALLEQRGCLSVQAVYTDANANRLAAELATALEALALRWPPVGPTSEEAAMLQQTREEADLRGLEVHRLALAAGTVIVDGDPRPRPGPGLRTVRVHPLDELAALPSLLAPVRRRLQGVALAGRAAEALSPALEELRVPRLAPAGELQSPDALWANGEVHLIERLA